MAYSVTRSPARLFLCSGDGKLCYYGGLEYDFLAFFLPCSRHPHPRMFTAPSSCSFVCAAVISSYILSPSTLTWRQQQQQQQQQPQKHLVPGMKVCPAFYFFFYHFLHNTTTKYTIFFSFFPATTAAATTTTKAPGTRYQVWKYEPSYFEVLKKKHFLHNKVPDTTSIFSFFIPVGCPLLPTLFNIFSKTTTTTTEALGARYESMNSHPTFFSNIFSTTTWYLIPRAFPPSLSGYVLPCSKKYFYIFYTTTTTAMNEPGARYEMWIFIHTWH